MGYYYFMVYKTNVIAKTSMYPLITYRERISIWEKARGMWKHREPEPIQELKKMRKEWDRKLLHTVK